MDIEFNYTNYSSLIPHQLNRIEGTSRVGKTLILVLLFVQSFELRFHSNE